MKSVSLFNQAASITYSASKQTFYTVRFLVDHNRVQQAYQAYAYFRWLDDQLDGELVDDTERIAFAQRQKGLMEACFQKAWPDHPSTEESMLVDLIQGTREIDSGLEAYLRNLMAVMVFDAHRRGRLVSQLELDEYTQSLAVAVTEALHYFIGHGCRTPGQARYLAATGAHITHILRDSLEDAQAGYYNIPLEYVKEHGILPGEVNHPAYRAWVKGRVRLAHFCFESGKVYLSQVQNLRCRIAGYAYIARFEGVLDAIRRDGYQLRSEYNECMNLRAGGKSILAVLCRAFKLRQPRKASAAIWVE